MIGRRKRKVGAEMVANTLFRIPAAPAFGPGLRRPVVLILASLAGLAALFAATA